MNKIHTRMLEALYICAKSFEGEDPNLPEAQAELAKTISEAEGGDEEAVGTLEAMEASMNAILRALLPMPDAVGAAMREAIQTECGDDTAAGPHECEAIWTAAITACLA